jgi:hypothetical protein
LPEGNPGFPYATAIRHTIRCGKHVSRMCVMTLRMWAAGNLQWESQAARMLAGNIATALQEVVARDGFADSNSLHRLSRRSAPYRS